MIDFFESKFSDDDDGAFTDPYVIVATFRAQYSGICNLDDNHGYKVKDIVGKLERTDNPFIPVSGVCCNRCVRTTPHKRGLV